MLFMQQHGANDSVPVGQAIRRLKVHDLAMVGVRLSSGWMVAITHSHPDGQAEEIRTRVRQEFRENAAEGDDLQVGMSLL